MSLPKRYHGLTKNIWIEYFDLAVKHKALNLGAGFADYAAPKYVTDALATVATSSNPLLHQYTRGFGHPRLVNAVSKLYSGVFSRHVDPFKNIIISGGATVSLYSAISALLQQGDEAVIIEPFFDCYDPMVRATGATPVFVPLRTSGNNTGLMRSSADWSLNKEELSAAFNDKTKVLILNTPNNPLGKVFKKDELQMVADLCIKHDIICISDEVYEWMIYPGNEMSRIANIPGMWDRTLTIGSAGKTFSVTGWKMGWTVGPEHLIQSMGVVHQNTCYTCATPLEEALGISFETELSRLSSPDCYFNSISQELQPKRDRLIKILTDVGLPVYVPEGGCFVICDISGLPQPPVTNDNKDEAMDVRLVKWLTEHHRLATIPCSFFYSDNHKRNLGEKYIRFCFFKKDETIESAGDTLRRWLRH